MSTHEHVMDDLALLVDGDETALNKHADHLADCADCRDARHDAEQAAMAARRAGSDYEVPADLESRLMARLESDPVPVPVPVPVPAPKRARRWPVAVGAGVLAAAAATAVLWTQQPGTGTGTGTGTGPGARVHKVERAAPATSDMSAGLAIAAPGSDFHRILAGDAIPAGSRVRTDASTRAWLVLDDGTALTLDHATELSLSTAARQIDLASGVIVADVAHVDGAPAAAFVTARARVEVLGTRFQLTAAADVTSVHVTRGLVRLSSSAGSVDVRAGEEGIAGDGAPEVSPVPALASEASWAELADAGDPTDTTTSGLGALRAYRPGESRDKDWPLALATHKVSVHVVGPLARTEIEETFRNDSEHELEGVYQFPLPADARIDGLALDDRKGGFIDGAFVDTDRGNKIWKGVIDKARPQQIQKPQEIIWVEGRWRDPALLEWQRGGRSELRIFPIPAHGSRTVKIAYTQVLAPHGTWRRYVYPLPHSADGSTAAEDFSVEVRVAGAETADVRSTGYDAARSTDAGDTLLKIAQKSLVPRGDLVVEHRPKGNPELRAWTFAGDVATAPDDATAKRKDAAKLGIDPAVVAAQKQIAADVRPSVVLALRPALPAWREEPGRDFVIAVDASQSMVGERRSRAVELAATLIGEMDRRDRVQVLSCDEDCRDLPGGVQTPTADVASAARLWLAAEQPAGASDLVSSLRAAILRAPRDTGREPWIVYVGDGFATTGFRRPADVEALVGESAESAHAHIVTVGIGGDADAVLLGAAARAGGGSYVPWVPGQRVATAALAVLAGTEGSLLRDATFSLPDGLVDVAPTDLPTIRAGEEVLIGARMTGDVKGEVVVRGTVAGQPWEQRYPLTLTASTAKGNAFVPRLWASLAIEQLERTGTGEDRAHIVAMSQAYGVLSRHTSLLVLESDAMFEAFGVERSRPVEAWTGTEALDEVSADGTIGYTDDDGESGGSGADTTTAMGRTASPSAKPAEPPAKMPDTKEAKADKSNKGEAKKKKAGAGDHLDRADDDMMSDPFGGDGGGRRGGMWMRREYYRVGNVSAFDGTSTAITRAVANAEAALAASPDSREKHRALVQALAYAGELERASTVAAAWLDRDQLDPQALVYMADVQGRQGRRADAVRTLSGIVDLSPDDVALHDRLASALDRAGLSAAACNHRVAIASISGKDAKAAGAALRCLRALGRSSDATRISLGLPDDAARKKADTAAGTPRAAEKVRGELTANAHWSGNADVDISIVTPQGQRLSWLGGRKGVTASDAGAVGRERLALSRAKKGRYLIEISRTRAGDKTPVSGTVEVEVLGVTRSIPFRLDGDRAVVGRVAVSMHSRLVPY